jgi:hypothetical protein
MRETHSSSDRTNSQGGNPENLSRPNTDTFHRRLIGLEVPTGTSIQQMDLGTSTSGSKNEVGCSDGEQEGVRTKRELDNRFKEYIKAGIIQKKGPEWVHTNASKYSQYKDKLFKNKELSEQDRLKEIEQYIQKLIEEQKSNIETQPEQGKATLEEISKHEVIFDGKQEQEERKGFDEHLEHLLDNDKSIRLEVIKLLKEKIREVQDPIERKAVWSHFGNEIDEYLRLRTSTSICQNVGNDVRYCYITDGGTSDSHRENLSQQKEIKDALEEIRKILHDEVQGTTTLSGERAQNAENIEHTREHFNPIRSVRSRDWDWARSGPRPWDLRRYAYGE